MSAGFGGPDTVGFLGLELVKPGFAVGICLPKALLGRISGSLATHFAPFAQTLLFLD